MGTASCLPQKRTRHVKPGVPVLPSDQQGRCPLKGRWSPRA